MAKTPKIEAPTMPADSGAAVYRDRAGLKLGGGPSEGACNFAAVTAEARKTVALLEQPAE